MRITGKNLHISLRIVLGIVLSVVVLIGIALLGTGIFLRQNPHALAEKLADAIRTRTGIECTMGLVDVAMLPIPALAVTDVRISTDTMTLTVAYATMRPSLRALLRGEFDPSDITLLRPDLRLKNAAVPPTPKAQGQASAAPYAAPKAQESATTKSVSAPMDLPVNLTIPAMLLQSRIIIQHGTLEVQDFQGRRVQMQEIRTDISPTAPDSVSGWVHIGTATVYDGDNVAAHLSALQVEMDGAILALHQGAKGRVRLQGQAFMPQVLYLDTMDIQINQGNSGPTESQPNTLLLAKMQGSFPFGGDSIPFHFDGKGKSTGQGPILIDNLDLGLDRDRLRIQGSMTLPKGDSLWPTIAGSMTIHRLSLPQWFGFGRPMPAGLQHTLDALTGNMNFTLNPKGLEVSHLLINVAGTTFEGTGGVASWAKPVIAINARSSQLTLDKALPEATGNFPEAPAYAHSPLTPEPGSDAAAGMNMPDLNYDIQLGVDSLHYGPLQMQKVQYRCIPAGQGTVDMRFGVGTLYGGSADGAMLLTSATAANKTQYTILANLKNIDLQKPLNVLTGSKWLGGRMNVAAQWRAEGKTFPLFLATLNGTSTIKIEDGFYDSPTVKGDSDKFVFNRLELNSRLRSQADPSPAKNVSSDLWTMDGDWQGQLHTKQWHGSVRLDGPISLHRKKGLPLTFYKVPGSFSVELYKNLTGLPQDVKAHATGRFTFNSNTGAFDAEDSSITAEGLELRGNLQSNLLALAVDGDVHLKSQHLRRALTALGYPLDKVPAKALQHVDGRARIAYSPTSLTLRDIKATIDSSHVTGLVEGQWQGRPQWKFDLKADKFDLAKYRIPSPAGKAPSTQVWNLKAMQGTDVQGNLGFGSLQIFKVHLQNAHIPVRLRNGTLDCAPLKAQAYSGAVTGAFHAESKNGLKLQLDIQATAVDMLGLTMDQQLGTVLGGKALLNGSTSGTIRSDSDIPVALSGTYGLEIPSGFYQSRNTAGALTGSKSSFNLVRGTGQMRNGVLHNNDFVMSSNNMRVSGKGEIDFVSDQLDYTVLVNLNNIAEFPIRYSGSLTKPVRTIQAGKAIVDTLEQLGSDVLGIVGDVLSTPFKLLR